ncbi:MAG TPA: alpha/beta fold hydrolase [Verrucomicrobiae bacterium]|nr:alpha/beta fold hydrolase [Verrucomicrobiae bacterium]
MKRPEIKNRHGLKLVIRVDEPEHETGLAFVAHGQGGFMGQKHIQAFAEAFLENGYRVVRFDATNSTGESDGDMRNVTITNYYEDLEDVVAWARTQEWFKQPFGLAGHSMGGMSTALYAENHPAEVFCVAPISACINQELFVGTVDPDFLKAWKDRGYFERESLSRPGLLLRPGWGFVEDLKNHDLLKGAKALTMPVLLMAGSNDEPTPYAHQKLLFDAIPGDNKRLIKIPNVDHNFKNKSGNKVAEVKRHLDDLLKELT